MHTKTLYYTESTHYEQLAQQCYARARAPFALPSVKNEAERQAREFQRMAERAREAEMSRNEQDVDGMTGM